MVEGRIPKQRAHTLLGALDKLFADARSVEGAVITIEEDKDLPGGYRSRWVRYDDKSVGQTWDKKVDTHGRTTVTTRFRTPFAGGETEIYRIESESQVGVIDHATGQEFIEYGIRGFRRRERTDKPWQEGVDAVASMRIAIRATRRSLGLKAS